MSDAMEPTKHHSEIGLREVLFEFRKVGKYIRVSAIDPDSGTEVIMIGDPKQGQEVMKRLATRKLVYVMNKKGFRGRGSQWRLGDIDEFA